MDDNTIRLDGYADILKSLVDLEVVRCKIFKRCKENGMNLDDASKLVNDLQTKAEQTVENFPIHV